MNELPPDPRGRHPVRAPVPTRTRRWSLENPRVRLGAGRVLGVTGRVFARQAPLFATFGLLVEAPLVVRRLGFAEGWWAAPPSNTADWIDLAGSFVAAGMLQCFVSRTVYADLSGSRVGWVAGLRGLRSVFSVLVVGVLVLLMLLAGLVFIALTVAPMVGVMGAHGALVLLAFFLAGVAVIALVVGDCFVAAQVAIVERSGPFRALSRSGWLTRGTRAPIVAIFFILYVAPHACWSLGLERWWPPSGDVSRLLVGSAFLLVPDLLLATAAAVVYHDLRHGKEGVTSRDILEVFA